MSDTKYTISTSSHVEGSNTTASNNTSHAEGMDTFPQCTSELYKETDMALVSLCELYTNDEEFSPYDHVRKLLHQSILDHLESKKNMNTLSLLDYELYVKCNFGRRDVNYEDVSNLDEMLTTNQNIIKRLCRIVNADYADEYDYRHMTNNEKMLFILYMFAYVYSMWRYESYTDSHTKGIEHFNSLITEYELDGIAFDESSPFIKYKLFIEYYILDHEDRLNDLEKFVVKEYEACCIFERKKTVQKLEIRKNEVKLWRIQIFLLFFSACCFAYVIFVKWNDMELAVFEHYKSSFKMCMLYEKELTGIMDTTTDTCRLIACSITGFVLLIILCILRLTYKYVAKN